MRDFSQDTTALALNTATLGHNLDGFGAGWSPEQVIDACAAKGFGGIVFWRREIGDRATQIGERVRATGMEVVGLCRTPFLVGRDAPPNLDEAKASIDMAADLGAPVLTIVTGGTEPGTKGSPRQPESLGRTGCSNCRLCRRTRGQSGAGGAEPDVWREQHGAHDSLGRRSGL